uniref:Uncharacterized protein n=1 Tax=Arundo donax TaxID=35708 RepID=A0A0A9AIH4_ARUDO
MATGAGVAVGGRGRDGLRGAGPWRILHTAPWLAVPLKVKETWSWTSGFRLQIICV